MAIPFHIDTARKLEILHADAAFERLLPQRLTNEVGHADDHCCGDCHACCIHLPIPAGEVCLNAKPPGVMCPHLGERGCLDYAERPATCRQFQCVWLTEPSWPLAWRPEESGLLCLRENVDNGVSAALVYEIAPAALDRSTTEPILARLTESTAVVAIVNLQKQRRLLRGRQWVDETPHTVRRPHFLKPIHSIQPASPEPLRDAS